MSEAPALSAELTIVAGRGDACFRGEASLSLDSGVLVLFGPSGAGKTLTLRALAGLVRPVSGHISLRGEPLFDLAKSIDVPVHRRKIGYVPQHHALFPFLDVEENVGFGLGRRERRRNHPDVLALLEELGVADLKLRSPASLSGGEKQRVALARALASRPRLLLLDEPFAAIDLEGRRALRSVIRRAIDARKMPAVLVTHDLGDAMAMGDRVTRFDLAKGGLGKTGASGPPPEILGELWADEVPHTART